MFFLNPTRSQVLESQGQFYAVICIHYMDKSSSLHMVHAKKVIFLTPCASICHYLIFFVLGHTQRYKAREHISVPVWPCQVMWFWICTDTGSSWGGLYGLCGNPMVQSSRAIGWWCQVWQVRHQQGRLERAQLTFSLFLK